MVELPFGVPTSHIRVSQFGFQLCFWFQLPAGTYPEGQQVIDQNLADLDLVMDSWLCFGPTLAVCEHLGNETNEKSSSVFASVSLLFKKYFTGMHCIKMLWLMTGCIYDFIF